MKVEEINSFIKNYQKIDNTTKCSNGLIAYSSQHIIAQSLQTKLSIDPITIQFSFLPVHSRASPTWSFTLPSLKSSSIQVVDHLLFSPTGNHLLISTQIKQQHLQFLRLSLLTQSDFKADHWSLTWDHLLPHSPNHPTHSRSVSKACFLAEPRRWFTEPASLQSDLPDQHLINTRSHKYQKLRRTPNCAINLFAQGKGQTAILVLSTNEVLVLHIPLPQLNLPPHFLLTVLDNSAVASEPWKLVPAPTLIQRAFNDPNPQPSSNVESNQPGLQSAPSKEHPPDHSNSPSLPSNPAIIKSCNDLGQSNQNHTPLLSSTDPNVTSNRKRVTVAAIGLPASSGKTFDQQLDQSRILLALQTEVTPNIPTSIFQTTVIMDGTEDQEAKTPTHQDDFQFTSSMGGVDDELGEFITGLGDLDDAFDVPMSNSNASVSGIKDFSKTKPDEEDGEQRSKQISSNTTNNLNTQRNPPTSDRKKNPAMEIPNNQHIKNHTRRFEPNLGIDDDHPSIGIPYNSTMDNSDHASIGLFIQLIEMSINFNHPGLVPTVTFQLLPNLCIIDPFDYTRTIPVVLRTLEFINVMPNSNPTNQERSPPLLRLLAGYSRAAKNPSSNNSDLHMTWIDELQLWDIRFLHSRLSNAFLAIDCLVDRNHSASSSPDLLLRGPQEWIFTRTVNKNLGECDNDTDLNVNERKSSLKICNILQNWKVRTACFILIVEKVSDSPVAFTTATTNSINDEESSIPRKKRKTKYTEIVTYECIVLNSKDLTTVATIPLPSSITKHEAKQLCLSYHGVWCCSLDESGRIRASPLITSKETEVIVSLIVSAIHNREPVDDISRFLNWTMSTTKSPLITSDCADTPGDIAGPELAHQSIFQDISSFLAHLNPAPRNYDLDCLLSPSWNIGFDLWSAIPGYQNAAEIALLGRQLFTALSIGTSVKAEAYSRSIWPMIGAARWYSRLCQRIVSSIDPDSKSAHLCLLPTTSCTFYHLFRVAMNIHQFSLWLTMINSSTMSAPNIHTNHQGQKDGKDSSVSFQDEIQIARLVFFDIWDHSNTIHMESWGKLLQDLGRNVFANRSGLDFCKLPIRQIENFSAPLAATDPIQVKESVEMLTGFVSNYHQLLKPMKISNSNNNNNRTQATQTAPTTTATTGNSQEEPEEENAKRLKAFREMSLRMNAEEDRKKYDILTGAKLELSGFHSARNSIRSHDDNSSAFQFKFQHQKISGSKHLQIDSIKECLKCGSRSSTLSWNYNHNRSFNSIQSQDGNNSLITGQFDVSIKEFNRVCICGGAWVSPSP